MSRFRGHRQVSHPSPEHHDAWLDLVCAHCGTKVNAAVVSQIYLDGIGNVQWLQCTSCALGTVRNPGDQFSPAPAFGPAIEGLPADIHQAYTEARRCYSVGGYVATELVCRRILIHIAVEKGADEGQSFAAYVTHLQTAGYVTPPMHGWVDRIRLHGNETTHELTPVTKERAEDTLMFTAELLRLTYEMDALAAKYAKQSVESPEPDEDEDDDARRRRMVLDAISRGNVEPGS